MESAPDGGDISYVTVCAHHTFLTLVTYAYVEELFRIASSNHCPLYSRETSVKDASSLYLRQTVLGQQNLILKYILYSEK